MFYRKWSRTIIEVLLLLLTIFLLCWLFQKAFQVAAPIFIAIFIYILISPVLKFLGRKGMKLSIATPISMLFFIAIIFTVCFTIGAVLASQIEHLAVLAPKCINYLKDFSIEKFTLLQEKVSLIPPDVMVKIKDLGTTLGTKLSGFTSSFLKGLFGSLTSLFTNTGNVLIGVIMAYLLCLESDKWREVLNNKTPAVIRSSVSFLHENVFSGIGKYIKAQFKLISMSFILVFVSLLIAGVSNAFSISVLAAIFDILPLLGMPVIFIPWAIYSFVVGKTGFAIFLIILLAVAMLFRQIMEPKIAGDSLGVSAFVMFSIMVISLSYFGVLGIIASPLTTIFLKSLYEQGYLTKWIHIPEDELKKAR